MSGRRVGKIACRGAAIGNGGRAILSTRDRRREIGVWTMVTRRQNRATLGLIPSIRQSILPTLQNAGEVIE